MLSLPALGRITLVAVLAAGSGCGGKSQGSGARGSAGSNGSAGSAPANECPSDIPSAAELAQTPRMFEDLELLALKFSSSIVADQAIYDRIVSDVGAIKQQNPSLSGISFYSHNDGRSLTLSVAATTYASMQAGTYDAWWCLDEAYGAAAPQFNAFPEESLVELELRGLFNMKLVNAQYAKLPGVQHVYPGGYGDGPTICVTRDGATWHYVFDDASGDCPAGCTEHVYTHFITAAPGVVTALGTPSADELRTLAAPDACH